MLCVLCGSVVVGRARRSRGARSAVSAAAAARPRSTSSATSTTRRARPRRARSAGRRPRRPCRRCCRRSSEHADGYVRYRALVLLTGFNDPRTNDAMRESLASPNDRLRTVAYSFFEHHPGPRDDSGVC